MKPIFSPEDFDPYLNERTTKICYRTPEDAAYLANKKIEKLMGPKVCSNAGHIWNPPSEEQNSFEAYLFNIQEIKRECGEHEPKVESKQVCSSGSIAADFLLGCRVTCRKCGVELKAKWEVAE